MSYHLCDMLSVSSKDKTLLMRYSIKVLDNLQ